MSSRKSHSSTKKSRITTWAIRDFHKYLLFAYLRLLHLLLFNRYWYSTAKRFMVQYWIKNGYFCSVLPYLDVQRTFCKDTKNSWHGKMETEKSIEKMRLIHLKNPRSRIRIIPLELIEDHLEMGQMSIRLVWEKSASTQGFGISQFHWDCLTVEGWWIPVVLKAIQAYRNSIEIVSRDYIRQSGQAMDIQMRILR